MELLLLSNSRVPGRPAFTHLAEELTGFAGGDSVLFVPYAAADNEAYTSWMATALRPFGIDIAGIHGVPDPAAAVRRAHAVFVGGGNSFRLLRALQERGLVDVIRAAVRGGVRYIGSSAGTNIACPTLRTTNDMPIVQPSSFDALNLVPFQINPHFLDPVPRLQYQGETREDRLAEFLEENDVPVVGLREGSWIRCSGAVARLGGDRPARLFARGSEPRELPAGADLSTLLVGTPHFDVPAQGGPRHSS